MVSILREEIDKCLNGTSSGQNQLLGIFSDPDETIYILKEYKMKYIALNQVLTRLLEYAVN